MARCRVRRSKRNVPKHADPCLPAERACALAHLAREAEAQSQNARAGVDRVPTADTPPPSLRLSGSFQACTGSGGTQPPGISLAARFLGQGERGHFEIRGVIQSSDCQTKWPTTNATAISASPNHATMEAAIVLMLNAANGSGGGSGHAKRMWSA